MKISIIIPTYNRCQNLTFLLERLKDLRLPEAIQCEIIIIDNNSTDCTKMVTENYPPSQQFKVRYIFEQKQGKSNALNTGIQQAEGDVVVFTDDDCIPDPTWIEAIIKEYASDPELAVLGGRVELYDERDQQLTLVSSRERVVMSSPFQLYPDPLIIGCNMAAKKEVFQRVGTFDVSLGPGTNVIAEDVDFVYRVYKKRFKVVYTPSVVVYHNHGRRTNEEVRELLHKYHLGRGAFYFKHILKADSEIARMAYWDVRSSLKIICARRGIKGQLIFLRALLAGAMSRMKSKNSN